MIEIQDLLKDMVDIKASDLHIKAPTGPVFRIDGALTHTDKCHPVSPEDVEKVFDQVTTETQHQIFFRNTSLTSPMECRDWPGFVLTYKGSAGR
jgi:twitching motility protein PilT